MALRYRGIYLFVAALGLAFFGFVGVLEPDEDNSEGEIISWHELVSNSLNINWQNVGEQKELPDIKSSLNLADLIDIAMVNNPTIRNMWALAGAAKEQYTQGKSGYYPEISATGTATRTRTPDNDGSKVIGSQLRPALTLSFLILDCGYRNAVVKEAYYNLMSSDWSYKWTLQQIVKDVITAYYNYLHALAALKAKEADLKDSEVGLKAAEEQHKVGVTTIADVLKAKSNHAKSLMSVESEKGNVQTTMGDLADVIGLPANTQLKVVYSEAPLNKVSDILENVDQIIALAKEQRADLASQRAVVKQKQYAVSKIRSQGLPNLSFGGSVGESYYHHRTSNPLSTKGYDCSGTLTLTVPLFKGFYYLSGTRAAKKSLKAAEANFDVKESQAILEVVEDYTNLRTAIKNLEFSNDYYKYSKQNYEVALHNYKAGVNSMLDLLNAQSSLADARDAQVKSVTDWYNNLAKLAYSSGTLAQLINTTSQVQ